ncbi:MAG: hypothetical protein BAJALOKI3v1_270030 [Promethearchaeota archaeon]|nr:MAG: hypothetical protein BAJALOKI3v1_270030 [Candidatus Lokiarchaeota archaeon]
MISNKKKEKNKLKSFKILYIYPFESFGKPSFLVNFLRISNYLNSKKSSFTNVSIKEEYLDLRFEHLPKFIPENLSLYRDKLNNLLCQTKKQFKFDLVAISCYSSFNYLNTLEVASMIKYEIAPESIIVVGGVHASMRPQDFQPGGLSRLIEKEYPKNTTPFDFLIQEEGEISFFKLVRDLINNNISIRNSVYEECIIREREIVNNLDEIPIINPELYEKYRETLKIHDNFYLDFSRGCLFRCNICPTSQDHMKSYKKVRYKSIDRCIEELKVIRDTKWLEVKSVYIVDLTFLPKRSKRKEFYLKLNNSINSEGPLPFNLYLNERIDLCWDEDLIWYKKLNIIPLIGLETGSKTLLWKMNKILGKNDNQKKLRIARYLKRAEQIIVKCNELDLKAVFYYMMGVPGTDSKIFKENREFFLEPRFQGESLIEKYDINLSISKYIALCGSEIYKNAHKKYNAKVYCKEWWKRFHKYSPFLGALVDPEEHYSLLNCLNHEYGFIKQLFKAQLRRKNKFYSIPKLLIQKRNFELLKKLYKEIGGAEELAKKRKNPIKKSIKILYIYPYESVGKKFCLPGIARISSFINSKKEIINANIEAEILDLKYELLPEYIPENLSEYRKKVRKILKHLNEKFRFDIVLIMNFDSFNYTNTLEVGNIIKHNVNKNAIIVVNGFHPTTCPEDFEIKNIPVYFNKTYPENTTPFDFIILEEGEIPFLNLVKKFSNNELSVRKSIEDPSKVLGPMNIDDLDEIPIINLEIFKKYADKIQNFYVEFNRGCMFNCNYCSLSGYNIPSLGKMRFKSIKKSIEELRILNETDWLDLQHVFIIDLVFYPNRKMREQFFEGLERMIEEVGPLSFQIYVMDRVDICTPSDLEKYKQLNIIPHIGLESGAKQNLFNMNKILGKKNENYKKRLDLFLEKTIMLFEKINQLDLDAVFFYLIGLPGENEEIIKENFRFFFNPKYDGKSLMEKYKINLSISKYAALPGSYFYEHSEEDFGTKIHFPEWWKYLHKYKKYFPTIVDPSVDLNLVESLRKNHKLVKKIYYSQKDLKNSYYTPIKAFIQKHGEENMIEVYEKRELIKKELLK